LIREKLSVMKAGIVVCCLLLSSAAFGQGIRIDTAAARQPMSTFATHPTINNKVGQVVPVDFYTQSFGFFCKQELKMEQAHVPVHFRLGSMDECNMLEGKKK
jgi:hypothetical protein